MRKMILRTILLLSLAMAHLAYGNPTPASLKSLLQGHLEQGVLFHEFLFMERPKVLRLFETKIEKRQDQIIYTRDTYSAIPARKYFRHGRTTVVYSVDGKLVRSAVSTLDDEGQKISSITTTLEGDRVRIVNWHKEDPEGNFERFEDRLPQREGSIHLVLEPLAVLYHLKRSHEEFMIRTGGFHHGGSKPGYNETTWRLVGKESIPFDDKDKNVRVFQQTVRHFNHEGVEYEVPSESTNPRIWITDQGVRIKSRTGTEDAPQEIIAVTPDRAEQLITKLRSFGGQTR